MLHLKLHLRFHFRKHEKLEKNVNKKMHLTHLKLQFMALFTHPLYLM